MKYGIISDIHSNIHAYGAAFEILDKFVDEIICLGDIVGYNANPKECISFTKFHSKITHVIQGNHDEHASNGLRFTDARDLSRDAYTGLVHTIKQIDESDREWLRNLKDYVVIKGDDSSASFVCMHGSPSKYNRYEYIFHKSTAYMSSKEMVSRFGVNIGFFGHTHFPTFYRSKAESGPYGLSEFHIGQPIFEDDICSVTFELTDKNSVYLINPGSIGQARTYGICSFAVFDSKTRRLHFERLQYDKEAARQAVIDAGYSSHIAERLKG